MMRHVEYSIDGNRGDRLYGQSWSPDGGPPSARPRALLLLVHGAGEHGGRYQAVAEAAAARGYALAVLDQVGHGRSGGTPGFVELFSDFVDDLATFDQRVRRDFVGLPVFLVGHSLGGLVACHYLLRGEAHFAGAALSGPLLALDPPPGAAARFAATLLGGLLPRLGVLKLDPAGVSRDSAVVEAYSNDPLVNHGKLRARFLREMFGAMDVVEQRGGDIELPLLVQHGEGDVMTAPAGSRALVAAAGSQDKTLQVLPGLFHEIYNEPERDTVLADLFDWLDNHLPPTPDN